MLRSLFIFIVLTSVMASCQRDDLPEPSTPTSSPPDTTTVEPPPPPIHPFADFLVWQKPISLIEDTTHVSTSARSVVVGDNYLEITQFDGPENALRLRNGQTGEVIWTWTRPNVSGGEAIARCHVSGKYIALGQSYDTYIVNARTGQSVWEDNWYSSGETGSFVRVDGERVYKTRSKEGLYDEHNYLLSSPFHSLAWDTLLHLKISDTYVSNGYPGIGAPTINEDIIYVPIVYYNEESYHAIWAINKRTQEILWRSQVRAEKAFYYSNKIYGYYGYDDGKLKCLDAQTGELLWQRQLVQDAEELILSHESIIIYENTVFVKTFGKKMYALDAETGVIKWEKEFNSHGPDGGLHPYKDGIYFMGTGYGKIQGVNIHTGNLIMNLESPHKDIYPGAQFSWSGVDVDPETGYLYVSDRYFTMCLDLNKIN